MRPLIGINCERSKNGANATNELDSRYAEAVRAAGGLPVMIPPLCDPKEAEEFLARLDGLVLSGGNDLDPRHYGETSVHPESKLLPKEKEAFDLHLAREAVARKIPTLGICYGMQLLSVVLGGKLHQHLSDAVKTDIPHRKGEHPVRIERESRLHRILGKESISTRSSHHQAVSESPAGLRVVARSADGVIEAVEGSGSAFLIGVQWHPERDPQTPELFRALVEESRRARDSRMRSESSGSP